MGRLLEEVDKKIIESDLFEIREKVDDLIDNLELLSDPKFRRELEIGLKEEKEGKVKEFETFEQLKEDLER